MERTKEQNSIVLRRKITKEVERVARLAYLTPKQMADKFDLALPSVYRILKNAGINWKALRKAKTIGAAHVLSKLGIRHDIAAKYLGVTLGRISHLLREPAEAGSQIPIVIFGKELDLRDDEGQIIHNGRYSIKAIGGDRCLLMGIDRKNKCHFTTFGNLCGRAKLDPRNGRAED